MGFGVTDRIERGISISILILRLFAAIYVDAM